ncbi:MAG: hypothetical protein KDE48_19100 [Anaerolineales bacterium]|nr:hypothetical protein [Anaerolineales bacterium]
MNELTNAQRVTRVAWIIFAINWMLVLLAVFLPIQGWAALTYGVWLLLSMPALALWLVWHYRVRFQTKRSLFLIIALLYISGIFVFGYRLNQPALNFVFTMIFWNCAITIGLTMGLFFWKNDFSIQFIGILSLLLLWGLIFLGRSQGAILQLFICNNATGMSCPYWPLAPLWCIFIWALPLGIIGFIRHTLQLLRDEW